MATINDTIYLLARAIHGAVDEHGRPNTFGCAELAHRNPGVTASLAGRIGRSEEYTKRLHRDLRGYGWESPFPTYEDRRWIVSAAKGGEFVSGMRRGK